MDYNGSESRRSPRLEINAAGTIILVSHGLRIGKVVKCLVINISDTGAFIHTDSPVNHPEFYLELNREPGRLRLCSLVRRQDNKIGVQFVVPAGKHK